MNVKRSWIDIYKTIAMLLLNTLLLFLLIELVSMLVLFVNQRDEISISEIQDQYEVDQLTAMAIAELYEIRNVPHNYYPYVTWRRAPYTSETINIDAQGIRHTPQSVCQDSSYHVHVYGGSTIWGAGSPDGETIPAVLQTRLAPLIDQPVCVVNYGQPAYVSTQGVIQLMLNVQQGDVPDLVVFYDGVNDVLSAVQNGNSSDHHNVSAIETRFESQASCSLCEFLLSTNTADVLQVLYTPSVTPPPQGQAENIIDIYLANKLVIDLLAEQYGFDYMMFWQPVAFVDKELAGAELQAIPRNGSIQEMFIETYDLMNSQDAGQDHIHSLSDVFENETGVIYIDPWHVVPNGNRLIVDAMMESIEPLVVAEP